jgi:uncharacterized protein (TIGR03435 family)
MNPPPQIRNQRKPRHPRYAPDMQMRRNMPENRRAVFAALFTLGLAMALTNRAQSQTQTQSTNVAPLPKFEYEVASIKPSNPAGKDGVISGMNYPADGFTARGLTLRVLLQEAFGIYDYQLTGAPAWINSEKFDVDAKMESSVADALKRLSPAQQYSTSRKMFLAILVDRLKLKYHRETKELPVYSLVVAKSGATLQETRPAVANSAGSTSPVGLTTSIFPGLAIAKAHAVPIADLAQMLSARLGKIVVDNTGLKGVYDFTLQWSTDDAQMQAPAGGAPSGSAVASLADQNNPVLSEAVQQLGLKLEPGKGPVEVIVIDHIERPSGN